VLLTIIATLITAQFRKVGLDAAVWQAIFIIAAFLAFVWLVKAVVSCCCAKTVTDVVAAIKKSLPQGVQDTSDTLSKDDVVAGNPN
jgi:ABC-type transport system involved in cytochrome bd biosynthesis fused ATPase/permease subunit